ncbi:Encoded by [Rhizoctonia solani]|uniref:Encoded by n=1 Tax=Rhizoctonia solani TaxID=456999 RepID=A0A8H7I884_9AGAM|nr:Encoded by [Rhizoctonia solani]
MEHEGSRKKQKKRLGDVLSLRKWLRSPEDKDESNSETFSSPGASTGGLSVVVGSGQSNNVAPSSMAKESSQAIQSSTSSTSALDTTAPVQEVANSPCFSADDLRLYLPMTTRKIEQDYKNITAELKSVLELIAKDMNDVSFEESSEAISVISQAIKKEIEAIGVHHIHHRLLNSTRCDLSGLMKGEASLSTWNTANKQHTNSLIEGLNPAKQARFDSSLSTEIGRRTCTENTRTKILQSSLVWSEEPNSAKVYWMNGMAGTGKTTIACSLCVELQARKQLAASFFCTRTSPECREAKRIVPTIAYQFARRSTPFRSALCKALEEDPDIGTPRNLVIVIDALDECIDPRVVEDFLSLLFRSAMDLPVRFYVTSRPEPAIRDRMMVESERSRLILYLHEIEHSLVKADIELYLREELAFMSPADADVKKLAVHAGNLFIYAATAVRYICPRKKGANSRTRLSVILAINMESKQKLSGIDDLYTAILSAAVDDQALEPYENESILDAFGLDDVERVQIALQPLRSVLHVSDHSELVTTLHTSFPDYMFDKKRSGRFHCEKKLRFNICAIKSSYTHNDEISGIEEIIHKNVSEDLFYASRFWIDHLTQTEITDDLITIVQNFLSQKLLFWMEVLSLKKCLNTGIAGMTRLNTWLAPLLVTPHHQPQDMLHMSIYQRYRLIPVELHSIVLSTTVQWTSQSLRPLTNKLEQSGLTTWKSTFPFSFAVFLRGGDLIALVGENGLNRHLKLGGSGPHPPVRTLMGHTSTIGSIDFSSDGARVVSASSDKTIRMWDVYTGNTILFGTIWGEQLSPPPPIKEGSVPMILGPQSDERPAPVKFSRDGSHIISVNRSFSDSIRIWNTSDGSFTGRRFPGEKEYKWTFALSPGGEYIAVVPFPESKSQGPDYSTVVEVWNMHTGILVAGPLKGHTGRIKHLGFSDDGTRIISASYDGSKSMGHSRPARSTNFPDQTRVAAAFDSSVDIWDSRTMVLMDRLSIGSKPMNPYAFKSRSTTPAFLLLVLMGGCAHGMPTRRRLLMVHIRVQRKKDLCSAVCSADGTRIVSWKSQIEFVELWDAQLHRSITYCKTGGYLYSPRVMLAQKGRRFITEVHYPERLLNIWDTEYGAHIAGPLRLGETLDFSPDGLYVVCQDHNNSTIGCLHVISVDSGDKVFKVDAPDSRHIVSAKFSWDGLSLVYNTRHTCYLWNTRDHTIHTIITEPAWTSSLNSRIYSTDGRYLASASDDETKQSDLMVWSFPIDKPSHITIRSDGWAVDNQSRVVFWVPAEIRKKTTECSGIVIEEDSGDWLCVDYNDMVVGDEWSHCYIGN